MRLKFTFRKVAVSFRISWPYAVVALKINPYTNADVLQYSVVGMLNVMDRLCFILCITQSNENTITQLQCNTPRISL